jgi:hypothetical protein
MFKVLFIHIEQEVVAAKYKNEIARLFKFRPGDLLDPTADQ